MMKTNISIKKAKARTSAVKQAIAKMDNGDVGILPAGEYKFPSPPAKKGGESLAQYMQRVHADMFDKKNPWVDPFENDMMLDEEAPQPIIAPKPARARPDYVLPAIPVFDESEINHVESILFGPSDLKPVFRMGIEFEGLIRKEVYEDFQDAMTELGHDNESGNNLISFGYDDSIRNVPAGYEPVEIRTETVRSRLGIVLLEDMLSFLWLASQTGDWLTNSTCGFHINISEDKVWEDDKAIDFYAHVLSMFDERAVLARFGRLGTQHGTKYCRPFFKDTDSREISEIKHQYHLCKRREKAARDRGDNVNQHIKESKYFAVALRDSPAHEDYEGKQDVATRIEFRCIGNESYHLKLDDLEESINHLITCVRLAFRAVVS